MIDAMQTLWQSGFYPWFLNMLHDHNLSECQILCLLFTLVCLSYKNMVQLVLRRMYSVLPYKDCMVHATADC